MARGEDTSKHPNRGVSRHNFPGGGHVDIIRSPELQRDIDAAGKSIERQKPVTPSGYGDYSDPSTRDAQRNTDRDFDKQEYDYNEHIKRSK